MKKIKTEKKIRKKLSLQDLALDTICSWLISSGFVLAIYPQISQNYSTLSLFLYSLAITSIIALASVRAWILPSIIGVATAISALVLFVLEEFGKFIEYADGLLTWIFSGMSPESVFNEPKSFLIMQIAVCVGVCAIIFIFVRLLHSVFPLVVAAFLLIGVYTLYGVSKNNLIVCTLICIGSLPIISSNFYSKRRSLLTIFKKKKTEALTPNWFVQTVACVVCALGIVISSLILPYNTSDMRKRFATNITADIQSATNIYSIRQKLYKPLNLNKLGLQPRMRIGGDLYFETNDIVALVESENYDKIFIKSTVLDVYDGTMWTSSFDTAYRYSSKYFVEKQNEVFDDYISTDKALNTVLKDIYTPKTAKITLIKPSAHLYIPSSATSFSESTPLIDPIMYNSLGEMFAFNTLPEGYTYEVAYNEFQLNFARIGVIHHFTGAVPDPVYKDEEFISHYTALPDNFPNAVKNHAQKITAECRSDYGRVAEMTKYLNNTKNFTYTNTPGGLPKNVDISYQLLSTKTGNSVYYASCLASMARSLGIPSRIVAGYYAQTWNEQFRCYSACESDAFAWVECYIKGVGWVSFNPSPIIPTEEEEEEQEENSPQAGDSEYSPPVEVQKPPQEDKNPEEPPQNDVDTTTDNKFKFTLTPSSALLYLFIILVLFVIIRSFFTKGLYQIEHVAKIYKGNVPKICEYYFADIRRQLRALGIKKKPFETLMEQLEKTTSVACYGSLERSFKIIEELRYAQSCEFSDEYAKQLHSTHLLLEDVLSSSLNGAVYLIKRRILLPGKLWYIISGNAKNMFLYVYSILKKFFFNTLKKINELKFELQSKKYQ